MKMMKNTLFLVLFTLFLVACGNENASTETSTETTNTEASATGEETPTSTEPTTEDTSGKITDAVVAEACNCVEQAKAEGSMDITKMQECMGGRTSVEFVKDVLGPDASDKEYADAEKALKEKMKAKCPMN